MAIFGYAICVLSAALGIGLSAATAMKSMARQPEVQVRLFTVFILASAFIEALALIGFVVTLIVH